MNQNPLRKLMKERRAELGRMTQQEAAARAGCNKATWNRWESEDQLPREENFPDIASALGLKVEDLRRAILEQWRDVLGEVSASLQLETSDSGIPYSGYKLRNPELYKLGKALEWDLSSIEDSRLQLYLSDWRGLLRGQLINADTLLQTLQSSVAMYRRFAIAMLGLPRTLFRTNSRRAKVRRAPAEKSSKDGEKSE